MSYQGESPDGRRKGKKHNMVVSSEDDEISMTPTSDDGCKRNPKGKGKGVVNGAGRGKQQCGRGKRKLSVDEVCSKE